MVTAFAGNVLLAVWTGSPPRAEDVRTCGAAMLQRAKALGRCALLVRIAPSMALPDEATRESIQVTVRKLDPYLVCGATVIPQEGIAGTAMRAVVSTLQLLSRPKHPEKIFATSKQAAVFLCGELERKGVPSLPVETLVAIVDELTKGAGAGSPPP